MTASTNNPEVLAPPEHPPGATLHLGGKAWAHPSLTDRLVPIETLHPFPGNPRRGDQDAITASIRDLGLYRALITQVTTGHVLAGNHTLQALIDLGATSAPVDPVAVDDTRAAALVARDNRTSDKAEYDNQALLDLLTTLDQADAVALAGWANADNELLWLQRRVEAEAIFSEGAGAGHMLDEFQGISGQEGDADYKPSFSHKTTVFFRDQAAVDEFLTALKITGGLQKETFYPYAWEPDDARRS